MKNNQIFSKHITFVIFAYNEEKRIDRVLKNLTTFGEVLVVDNYSSDKTVEIANSYDNCDVMFNKNTGWVEDDITTARVKETVKTEWIYWGFLDEMLDASSFYVIDEAMKSGRYDIINITRKNYFYGKFFGDAFSDRLNRIFKKDAIDFIGNKIHHFGKVTVSEHRILKLDKGYYVHHFINSTTAMCLNSWNRYSDLEVSVGHRRKYASFFTILLRAIKRAILNLFFKKGFKAGMAAVNFCVFTIIYDVITEMKIYEANHGIDIESIEAINDLTRDKIIDKIQSL